MIVNTAFHQILALCTLAKSCTKITFLAVNRENSFKLNYCFVCRHLNSVSVTVELIYLHSIPRSLSNLSYDNKVHNVGSST